MKNKRRAYEEKLNALLDEWNAQVLCSRPGRAREKGRAEAKIEYYKTIKALCSTGKISLGQSCTS